MGFTRNWDSSCPRVWDAWEAAGTKWVIQDLAPEDEDTALQILIDHLLDEETLCKVNKIKEDPVSLRSFSEFWRECFKQRMSLGCYAEVEGKKTLIALNVCVIDLVDEKFPNTKIEGDGFINLHKAMDYIETKYDPFEYLGVDKLMHAFGLIVKPEYRGHKLGSRILAARQPFCLSQGVYATATLFTGPASQKSAERCGFETICAVSLKNLAEQGLNYSLDDGRVLKLMCKKYCD